MIFSDRINDVLQTLTEAPKHEINPKIVQKLRDKIAAGITSGDLSVLIDECKRDDLASDFALIALRIVYQLVKNEEVAQCQNSET